MPGRIFIYTYKVEPQSYRLLRVMNRRLSSKHPFWKIIQYYVDDSAKVQTSPNQAIF